MERAVADVLAPRCDGSIVIGIFQGFAQTLLVLVGRHIAQTSIVAQTAIVPAFGSGAQQARELVRIGRLVDSAQDGFHDDRHGVITDHHVRFAGKHVPHGQVTLVLRSEVHHRLHHVSVVGWREEIVERMGSAVGVPQREGAVVLLPLCQPMHLAVCPEVTTIDIAIQGGTEVGMIEGGVEDAPLCRCCPHEMHTLKARFPQSTCLAVVASEVEILGFCAMIALRPLHIHTRERGGEDDLVASLHAIVEFRHIALMVRGFVFEGNALNRDAVGRS